MASFKDRLQHAWNAFAQREPPRKVFNYYSNSSFSRPDRVKLLPANSKTIISSIYTRISIDVAEILIQHVRVDDEGNYISNEQSSLNYCLTKRGNLDQSARALKQDLVMSMLDEGVVALVPVDTDIDPEKGSFKINSLRTGKIIEWYPERIKVNVYDEREGKRKDIIVPKKSTVIIENPFYNVMNEPNSTLKRLNEKLNLIDRLDEKTNSGKLDLVIQLPYVVKNQKRQDAAENRRKDIEMQLAGSKYGIAYIDGTEKITQLNRPVENNLFEQAESLKKELLSQLSITEEILNGTADEKTMLNYYNQTIEPILEEIVEEIEAKFLTKTAVTQGQAIKYFRDPFKLVPVKELADIADKFTRNEIYSSNEFRAVLGKKPSSDPRADELRNKNINSSSEDQFANVGSSEEENSNTVNINDVLG